MLARITSTRHAREANLALAVGSVLQSDLSLLPVDWLNVAHLRIVIVEIEHVRIDFWIPPESTEGERSD
jgi:hypothetical protein